MKKLFVPLLIITLCLINSCKDPDQSETDILNEWIWDVMTDVYLWADDIDRNLYPTNENDPEAFFYSILSEEDRFSWIVDDYQELLNSFNNIELSSGISPYFIRITDSDDVIAVVEYVIKGSPADRAGIIRGEIITDINNTTLDINNYTELFYTENQTLEFADYRGGLIPNGKKVSLTAEVVESNPVQYHDIIQFREEQIGYIVYTGFSDGEQNIWIDSLDNIFADFNSIGLSNIIIDLRYNPGGRVTVANHLASLLAPENVPDGKNVLVNFRWNDAYQDYFINSEGSLSENLVVPFEDLPSQNLNLAKVYFLTSFHSASASELLIIGLEPYMEVIQVGESTYGKFHGSITIPDTEKPARHNWAMQPLVFKYTNAEGYTDFYRGLIPDILVEDNILLAKPFGDITDPILAAALEDITGVSPIVKKAGAKDIQYTILTDPVRERKSRAALTCNRQFSGPGE